jgi:hypothetical protein
MSCLLISNSGYVWCQCQSVIVVRILFAYFICAYIRAFALSHEDRIIYFNYAIEHG